MTLMVGQVLAAQSDTSGMVVFRMHTELDDPKNDWFDTLYFNRSYYLYIEKRNRPMYTTSSGMTVRTPQKNNRYYISADLSYRLVLSQNYKKKRIEYRREELPPPNWKLSSELKLIDGYQTQKATATEMPYAYPKLTMFVGYFTPSIPIRVGPAASYGLPGLVLEYEWYPDYGTKWTVERISFEPVSITAPNPQDYYVAKPKKMSGE